jgi:hypothetical protein
MDATGDLAGRRRPAFAIDIKPILVPVRCPAFLKSACLLGGGDTESSKRQDHGANTDVRLRAFANMPTPRTPKNWGTDVSIGSNSLKRRVQIITQLHDCVEGHALMPLGAQLLNYFREPYSLRSTCSHIWTIVVPLQGAC